MPAPVYHAPPPPPVYNWTGGYIAGGGGYALVDPGMRPPLPRPGLPFSPRSRTAAKAGLVKAKAAVTIILFSLGTWNMPLVVGVFGDWEGGNIRAQSATRLRSELKTTPAPGQSVAAPATWRLRAS